MSAEISDPFNPNKHIQAYKSVNVALSQLRDGKPDWLLFKRGDKFELQETMKLNSGKSDKAHLVLSSYGDSEKRPLIDSKNNSGITLIKGRSYITVKGLEFYASSFDPKSSNFIGWGNSKNSEAGFASISTENVSGFFLEDNIFNFYRSNIVFSGSGNHRNIVVRRNLVMNAYSENSHAQGIYIGISDYVLMEENTFDHNGWYQQRPSNIKLNTRNYGYATFYNHNIYISNSSNLVIRENLSSRSSSIGMKFTSNPNKETKVNTVNSSNILLQNNLIVEGEVGFSIGGNTNFNNGYRWDNILVTNNVLTNIGRTKPTNRNLAFNIEASDWDTGAICSNTIVDGNDKELSNTYGILTNGYTGEISVINNKIVNFGLESEQYASTDNVFSKNNKYTPILKNVNFLDNYVHNKGYSTYSSFILDEIKKIKDSSSTFYDISEPLSYIHSRAHVIK